MRSGQCNCFAVAPSSRGATDVKSLQICDCGETGREFLLGCSRLMASAKAWFCLYASARNPLSVNFSFIYPCGQRKWTSISSKFRYLSFHIYPLIIFITCIGVYMGVLSLIYKFYNKQLYKYWFL